MVERAAIEGSAEGGRVERGQSAASCLAACWQHTLPGLATANLHLRSRLLNYVHIRTKLPKCNYKLQKKKSGGGGAWPHFVRSESCHICIPRIACFKLPVNPFLPWVAPQSKQVRDIGFRGWHRHVLKLFRHTLRLQSSRLTWLHVCNHVPNRTNNFKVTYWRDPCHLRRFKCNTTKGSPTHKCLNIANRSHDVTNFSIKHFSRLLRAVNTPSFRSRNHIYRLYSCFTRSAGQTAMLLKIQAFWIYAVSTGKKLRFERLYCIHLQGHDSFAPTLFQPI